MLLIQLLLLLPPLLAIVLPLQVQNADLDLLRVRNGLCLTLASLNPSKQETNMTKIPTDAPSEMMTTVFNPTNGTRRTHSSGT